MALGCCSQPGWRRTRAPPSWGLTLPPSCGALHGISAARLHGFCKPRCRKAAWAPGKRYGRVGMHSEDEVITVEELMESATEAAEKAKVRASFGLAREVEVQALVLRRLGFRSGGKVLWQRPMTPEDFNDTACTCPQRLAQRLHGHNAFDQCCLPLLKALSMQSTWPLLLFEHHNRSYDITCVPTLELCAAICTRILCCASRLQKAKTANRLMVLGVGDQNALLQASVALHLGTVLREAVDLTAKRIVLRLDEGFTIEFIAMGDRDQAQFPAMPLTDIQLAQLSFYSSGSKVYLLVDGQQISLQSSWIMEDDGQPRANLEEVCTVNLPESMAQAAAAAAADEEASGSRGEPPRPPVFRLTELFPKTLSDQDFLGRGFKEPEPQAGLFHTHMFVQTRPKATLPFLAPQLCHDKGPYDLRMKADKALLGLHRLRDATLVTEFVNEEDLRSPLPIGVLEGLKDSLYNSTDAKKVERLRRRLSEAAKCCEGRAKKQLLLLLKNESALRMERAEE